MRENYAKTKIFIIYHDTKVNVENILKYLEWSGNVHHFKTKQRIFKIPPIDEQVKLYLRIDSSIKEMTNFLQWLYQ